MSTNKTEYIVKAFEYELGDDYFKVIVPDDVSREQVMAAFKAATAYVNYAPDYSDLIYTNNTESISDDEFEYILENEREEYVALGVKSFDEHFEKMLNVEDEQRLYVFQYYITECMGWKIEDLIPKVDFEFEW